jgi:hypothetical protein
MMVLLRQHDTPPETNSDCFTNWLKGYIETREEKKYLEHIEGIPQNFTAAPADHERNEVQLKKDIAVPLQKNQTLGGCGNWLKINNSPKRPKPRENLNDCNQTIDVSTISCFRCGVFAFFSYFKEFHPD